jgi:hypothetical protein
MKVQNKTAFSKETVACLHLMFWSGSQRRVHCHTAKQEHNNCLDPLVGVIQTQNVRTKLRQFLHMIKKTQKYNERKMLYSAAIFSSKSNTRNNILSLHHDFFAVLEILKKKS